MSAKIYDEMDVDMDDVFGEVDNSSLATKLERRRRIEDLEEERRLRLELEDYN